MSFYKAFGIAFLFLLVALAATKTTLAAPDAITISKQVEPTGAVTAGDTITYTIEMQNSGFPPIITVVSDPLLPILNATCVDSDGDSAPLLEAGTSAQLTLLGSTSETFTCTVEVPQSRCGTTITNVATAISVSNLFDPIDSTAVSNPVICSDSETVGIDKQVEPTGAVTAGDTVTYTLEVTNNGELPAAMVVVDLPLVDLGATCVDGDGDSAPLSGLGVFANVNLLSGASETYTCTFVVQEDDCNSTITNTAIAAFVLDLANPVQSAEMSTPVVCSSNSTVGISKQVEPVGAVTAGDTITYTIGVTNTGLLPALMVVVDAPLVGRNATCVTSSGASAPLSGLGVFASVNLLSGASETYTCTIEAQPSDCGSTIDNSATAAFVLDLTNPVQSAEVSTPVLCSNSSTIGVSKQVEPVGAVTAGDTITYTIGVTNSGLLPAAMIVADLELVGRGATCVDSNGDAAPLSEVGIFAELTLLSSASETYTCTLEVQEADCGGTLTNVATAAFLLDILNPIETAAVSTPVLCSDSDTVGISKQVEPAGAVTVGDTVTYTIEVTNDGLLPAAMIVADPLLLTLDATCVDSSGANAPLSGLGLFADVTLLGDQSETYTCTFEVQESACNSTITNIASAAFLLDPLNLIESAAVETPVLCTDSETVGISKQVEPTGAVTAGDTVTYTLEVTNDGILPAAMVVADPLLVTLGATCVDSNGDSAPLSGLGLFAEVSLLGNESETYTCTFEVPENRCNSIITNMATAAFLLDIVNPVESAEVSTAVVCSTSESVGISKQVEPIGAVTAGDTITYTIGVTNSSSLLAAMVVADLPLIGRGATCFDSNGDAAPLSEAGLFAELSLLGSTSETYTCSFVVQEDDCGTTITNIATAAFVLDPLNLIDSAAVSTPVLCTDNETVGISKQVEPTGAVTAGDTVTYTIEVTNDGVLPGAMVVVDLPLVGRGATCVDSAGNNAPLSGLGVFAEVTLLGNQSETYTCTFEVVEDDCGTTLTNVATAVFVLDPLNPIESAAVNTPVLCSGDEALKITKQVEPAEMVTAGDTVTYTISVTNTEALPALVNVVDLPLALLLGVSCVDSAGNSAALLATGGIQPVLLASGENETYTCTYQVDAAFCGQTLTNVATAVFAVDLLNPIESDGVTTNVGCGSSLGLSLTADPVGSVQTGETVTYTLQVTNSNPFIMPTIITDLPFGLLAGVQCQDSNGDALPRLAQGQPQTLLMGANSAETITCVYTVQQSQCGGTFINSATAVYLIDLDNLVESEAVSNDFTCLTPTSVQMQSGNIASGQHVTLVTVMATMMLGFFTIRAWSSREMVRSTKR